MDVRQEVLASAGSLALLVMLAGFAMPRLALDPAANWFADLVWAPVNRIEQAGQRAFLACGAPPAWGRRPPRLVPAPCRAAIC